MNREIATPSRTKEILQRYGFTLKKSLGQNFIMDTNILQIMVEAADLDQDTLVIEVGPGIGALTEQLAKRAAKVLAFEIDQRLIPVLEETLSAYPNVKIIHQDILKADLAAVTKEYLDKYKRLSVAANLPYYITTPVILKFLQAGLPFVRLVFMMQKEVAERINAQPGSKAYGSLSILTQYYSQPRLEKIVPRTVFVPPPNVDSAIVSLTPRTTPPVKVLDEAFFFRVVKACFHQRRKTLYNNLIHALLGKENREVLTRILEELKLDGTRRGETLTIEEFARLTNALYSHVK